MGLPKNKGEKQVIVQDKNFLHDYIKVWDDGAIKDAPFITIGA